MVKSVAGLRGVAFAAGVSFLAVSPAQAALIDNGSYTSDTVTGLDWLDLTSPMSLGKSFNTVTGLFATTLAGWHYASGAQVSKLFDDAGGIGPYDFSGSPSANGAAAQLVPVNLLNTLLGNTGSLGGGRACGGARNDGDLVAGLADGLGENRRLARSALAEQQDAAAFACEKLN